MSQRACRTFTSTRSRLTACTRSAFAISQPEGVYINEILFRPMRREL